MGISDFDVNISPGRTLSACGSVFGLNARLLAWIGFAVCVSVLAAGANLLPREQIASAPTMQVSWQAAADESPPTEAGSRWINAPWWLLDSQPGPIWLRIRFAHDLRQQSEGSLALRLSGPMSANVHLNGLFIGGKGRAALDPEGEIAGPIDMLLSLGDAVRPGSNEMLILISAHHLNYQPNLLVQNLAILQRTGDPRRPVSQYLLAFALSGGLVLLLVFALRNRSAIPGQTGTILAASIALILIALLAETARVWWNYPYPLHAFRMAVVYLALTGAGVGVLAATSCVTRRAVPRAVIAGLGLALFLIGFGVQGFDGKTAASLGVLAIAMIGLAAPLAIRGDPAMIGVCLIAAAETGLLAFDPAGMLDNGVYLILAAQVINLLACDRAVSPVSMPDATFTFETDGRRIIVVMADISHANAAGNYVELCMAGGTHHLLRVSLGRLHARLGNGLIRIHRSHMVNPSRALRIRATTGSRYWLDLTDGTSIPVSRGRVDEVRRVLEDRRMANLATF